MLIERGAKESDAAFAFRLMEFEKGTPEHEEMKRLINAADETSDETLRFKDGSILMGDRDEFQVWDPEDGDE